jgi:hypothetical protein
MIRPEGSVPPVDPAGAATTEEVAGELCDRVAVVVGVLVLAGVAVAGRVGVEVGFGTVTAALSVILVMTLA